ncbi:hypothetical protein QBC45DRAFT_454281 [Copromyces sp. CBS 386.78]|nr:hypothetical protein QBC45DRAFT_454281 [Copromyces sp. CBS 386.78]
MSFTSTFDWVPLGLTFTDTTQDPDLHIHYGGLSDSNTADPTYRIKTTTPNPSYLTPPLWIKSIVSQHSKSLILLESRNGPQEPGFAAPQDVFFAAVKELGLKKEQIGRIIGKNGSLTDYFFSENASDASVEIAFRWTSMPGCYVIFFGRFTPRVPMGELDTKRMSAVVSHRGLFPSSFSKDHHDNKGAQNNDVMDHELNIALVNRSEEIQENPLRVFTVLLQVCVCHLDEEIHELGVRLEDTPSGAVAQIAKEMAPDICGMKKACNDLLAICGGYSNAANIWRYLGDTGTKTCVNQLRRDVDETKMLVERRLEKLNYIDGVCSRMVMGTDSGRGNRHMEC